MKERKSERTNKYKKLDLDARIHKIYLSRLASAKNLICEPPKGPKRGTRKRKGGERREGRGVLDKISVNKVLDKKAAVGGL